MNFPEFQAIVAAVALPVILLEGSRDLPETDAGRLAAKKKPVPRKLKTNLPPLLPGWD